MCNGFWLRFTFDECSLCLNCVCGRLSLFKLLRVDSAMHLSSRFFLRSNSSLSLSELIVFVLLAFFSTAAECVCVCACSVSIFLHVYLPCTCERISCEFSFGRCNPRISTAYRIIAIELRCSSVYIDTTLWCCFLIINTIHLCNAMPLYKE